MVDAPSVWFRTQSDDGRPSHLHRAFPGTSGPAPAACGYRPQDRSSLGSVVRLLDDAQALRLIRRYPEALCAHCPGPKLGWPRWLTDRGAVAIMTPASNRRDRSPAVVRSSDLRARRDLSNSEDLTWVSLVRSLRYQL
jgi:hypothetical protein